MNAADRAILKEKIEEQLVKIAENIADLEELTKPIAPENSIGRISRMDAINNKSINEAALRQAHIKHSKLKHAISKVEDPSFGACSMCKNDIQPKRLMFLPESTLCVRCAAR